MPIVWVVQDMKSNLSAAGIRTHDLLVLSRTHTLPLDQLPPIIGLLQLPFGYIALDSRRMLY